MQKTTKTQAPAQTSTTLIDDTASWLMSSTLGSLGFEDIFSGCCERLFAAGVPISRAHISYSTLHPLYTAMSYTWTRGDTLEVVGRSNIGTSEGWIRSPLYHLIHQRIPFLRRRLTGPDALLDFPMLEELASQGATDYFAYTISFSDDPLDGLVGSWASDRRSGFHDHDLVTLRRIQQRLAVACKTRIKSEIAENVVTTYLGRDAGLRVLDGQIRRGDGESLRAVYWYSDLRGSTRLAGELDPETFINLLNCYFEVSAGAVIANGGEVLSFIGDAVLGVFAVEGGDGGAGEACERAAAAQADARDRLTALNGDLEAHGRAPLRFGLGLHVGEAVYGNIGVPERLAFTVIGAPVNEVARLEEMTKLLDEPVLASSEFARHLARPWRSLGRYELRGVAQPVELFAPPI